MGPFSVCSRDQAIDCTCWAHTQVRAALWESAICAWLASNKGSGVGTPFFPSSHCWRDRSEMGLEREMRSLIKWESSTGMVTCTALKAFYPFVLGSRRISEINFKASMGGAKMYFPSLSHLHRESVQSLMWLHNVLWSWETVLNTPIYSFSSLLCFFICT